MDDVRRKRIRRQFVFDVDDFTDLPFEGKDVEDLAEKFEVLLQQRYDTKVVNLEIRTLVRDFRPDL